ncbi:MAG: hypothetical protein Athens071416_251 [Parcubacteria group bacterium Athens0714_16]|nr:MAG: hypothetical protein Athens071416_251 [Parcubacteria group bacterium Athens0714_16]
MPEETPQQEKKQRDGVIRTYEGDISDVVKFKKASVAGIAVAEQKRRDGEGEYFIDNKKESFSQKFLDKKTLITGGSILLFVIAIIIIILSLTGTENTADVKILPTQIEIIFSNETKNIDVTGVDKKTFVSKVLEERKTNKSQLGSITKILATTEDVEIIKILTPSEFLNLLEIKLPVSLSKYLSDEFMFGIHSVRNIEPFIILKTSSFENAFTGMLEWEKTMENDLGPIFIDGPSKTTNKNSTEIIADSGTTTSESFVNIKKTFEDIVIRNKDTRVLNDAKGNSKLMYLFPDRETILITTNQYTVAEILDRLIRVKFGQ